MENNYSLSDIASALNGCGMGNEFIWIFALLILFGGNFGGFNRNNYNDATTQEILYGQQFQNIDNKLDRLGKGIADSTFALNNAVNGVQTTLGAAITTEGRNIQSQLCAINSNIDNKFAALEKSQLEQRINEQAQQISSLQTQQMFCGVPKINPYGYNVVPNSSYCCNNNI